MSRKAQLLALLGLVCVWVLVAKGDVMKKPRGIRNNNPGNIRKAGSVWQGQIGDDGDYLIFDTPENGIRALARLIHTYATTYGLRTVQAIVSRWAPTNENDTAAYIASVAKRVGVGAGDVLSFNTPQLQALVGAIIYHENGQQPYTSEQILAGIKAAGWPV